MIFDVVVIIMWCACAWFTMSSGLNFFLGKDEDEEEPEGTTVTAKCVDVKMKRRHGKGGSWQTIYTPVWEYEFGGATKKFEGWYYGKIWEEGDTTFPRIDPKGNVLYEDTPEAKRAATNSDLFVFIMGIVLLVYFAPAFLTAVKSVL